MENKIISLKDEFKGTFFYSLIETFFNSQISLQEVKRWDGGLESINGTWIQSTLQHLQVLKEIFISAIILIKPHMAKHIIAPLSFEIISACADIHDNGEGILKRDKTNPKKTEQDDLDEYLAYLNFIKDDPKSVKDFKEKAFLLQFCLNIPKIFPERAKDIMQELSIRYYYEALTFKALEKIEYLVYPIMVKDREPKLLTAVISKQLVDYHNFSNSLPGFKEEIYNDKLKNWLLNYVKEHPLN